MKTDTQIMNELAVSSGSLKPQSEVESKAQKALLLEMYKDIASLCDKHGLFDADMKLSADQDFILRCHFHGVSL